MLIFLIPIFLTNDIRLKFIKIRQIDNRVNYEELQEELMDRFGEYPDVVAYLLEIGLVKSYLDKVFVQRVERKENKITVQFEKVTQRLFWLKIILKLYLQQT